jgi:hypothetical protein
MDVIMPKVVGYKIMTPDQKTVISEHGPDELEKCRKLIQGPKFVMPGQREVTPVLQYIFEKVE